MTTTASVGSVRTASSRLASTVGENSEGTTRGTTSAALGSSAACTAGATSYIIESPASTKRARGAAVVVLAAVVGVVGAVVAPPTTGSSDPQPAARPTSAAASAARRRDRSTAMGVAGAYSPTRSTLETAMPVADATPPALHLFGHACLGIEAGGRRLLVDPWLVGSCYWRAWWHFPAPPELPEEWLAPDAIYLSHHHFDHFHYPSMRRLDRAARVYVPRFGVDVLRGELAGLGFHDVVELAHGEPRAFGDGARIASYQHGFDDSALVVADGDVVIVDLNDCKLRGRALRQVVRTFGRPTFMLRTHSWAQSYPIQYEAEDPADLELITDETFLRDF